MRYDGDHDHAGGGGLRVGAEPPTATNGNDAWSGKLAAPNAESSDGVATLQGPRDAIRAVKAQAASLWAASRSWSRAASTLDAPLIQRRRIRARPRTALCTGRPTGPRWLVGGVATSSRSRIESSTGLTRPPAASVPGRPEGARHYGFRPQRRGSRTVYDNTPMTVSRWPNEDSSAFRNLWSRWPQIHGIPQQDWQVRTTAIGALAQKEDPWSTGTGSGL